MGYDADVIVVGAGLAGLVAACEVIEAGLIISIVLTVLDIALLGSQPGSYGILTSIWGLATLIPGLALAVRRLHDIDKSGW